MINFYLVVINVNRIQYLKKKTKESLVRNSQKIKVYCNQCEYKTTFETLLNNSYLLIHEKSDLIVKNINIRQTVTRE